MRCLTCYREDVKVSHAADVLKAEVPDLRAPTQKEGGEGQHCGDVANPNITDVDTPAGVLCQPVLCGGAAHLSSVSCSRWVRSHAMYSSAASVIRGHHETSRHTCLSH